MDAEELRRWAMKGISEVHERHKREMEVELKPFIDMLALLPSPPVLISPEDMEHILKSLDNKERK